jgi:SAP domain-containing ribonucleoprotein
MMDYSKLKVAELKDLLTSRSLPVSGKKEELVARLVESDKGQPVVDDLGDLAPPEEEYDWDAPTTKTYCSASTQLTTSSAKPEAKPAPAPAAPSVPAKPQTATPAVPSQPLEAPKAPAETTTKSPPAASTTDTEDALAIELEKRKRRAERFGIPLAESAKAIERVKRFGDPTSTTEEAKKEARAKKFGNQVWAKNGKTGNTAQKKEEKATPVVNKVLDDPVEAEKARKRAERFGGGNEAKKVKT